MKRIVVVVLWLVGLIVLALFALAVALPFLVDPNDYRERIERMVGERTGREVAIEGELSLSLFPWLGLETGRIVIGNPPGFDPGPMASVEETAVRVRLLPLLRREVEADSVLLRGLSLDLVTLEDGRSNWDDLLGDDPGPRADPAPDPQPGDAEGVAVLAALAIQGVAVREGRIRYEDRATLETWTLERLELETGMILPGRPVSVRLRTDAGGSGLPEPLEVALDTELEFASDHGMLTAREVEFSALGRGIGVRVAAQRIRYSLTEERIHAEAVDLDGYGFGQQGRIRFAESVVDLGVEQLSLWDVEAGGEVMAMALTVRSPEVRVDYAAAEARVQDLAATVEGGDLAARVNAAAVAAEYGVGRFALEDLNAAVDFEALSAALRAPHLRLSVPEQRFELPAFVLESEGARLEGDLRGEQLLMSPALSGTLRGTEIPLRALLARVGMTVETQDPSALAAADLATGFEARPGRLVLQSLELRIDETTVRGSLDLAAAPGTTRFDLEVGTLDIDRYLPPTTDAAGSGNGGAGAAAAVVLPVALLREVESEGRLRVRHLASAGLDLEELDVRLRSSEGRVSLAPIRARLYGGTSEGEIQVDVAADPPVLRVRERLSGIDVQPALAAAGVTDRLSGRGDLDLDLSARGVDGDQLVRSLEGQVRLDVRDGAIRGFDLRRMLVEAQRTYDTLRGREPGVAEDDPDDQTRFSALGGSLDIRDGVANNDDLSVSAPLFRATGRGSADLVREQIDYLLEVNVVETLEGQDGPELSELRGVSVPVRITGPMASPRYRLDLAGLARGRAEEELREQRRELEERARERLERELRDRLGSQPEERAREGGEHESQAELPDRPAPQPEERTRERLERELRDRLLDRLRPRAP